MPRYLKLTALTVLALVAIALPGPAHSAAESDTGREVRPLQEPSKGPINAIELVGPIDLTLVQGLTNGLALSGKADDRARIRLEVNDHELRIIYAQTSGWLQWGRDPAPTAVLAVPELRQLVIKGSGDARIVRFDQKDTELRLQIDGSGDIHVEHLKAKSLQAGINGSGDISVSGEVAQQGVTINGSGDYSAEKLMSRAAQVSIRGSGDARVNVSDTLAVDIAGSGDVSYTGSPTLAKTIRGSGEVTQRASK